MELIVDARSLSTLKPAGVARYVASISSELQRQGAKLIFVSNRKIYLPHSIDIEKCVVKEYIFLRYIPGTLFIMFLFPLVAQRLKGSVFWGGSFAVPVFGFKSIVTIHDLVPFEFPKTVTPATFIFGRLSIKLAIRRANVVTAVSEFTRQRLKLFFPQFNHLQVSIVRCGVDGNIFYEVRDKARIQEEISSIVTGKFVLAVGSIEPRKNLESLILAFYKLKESGYEGDLVLVGGGEWKSGKIRKLIGESRYSSSVKFTGYIEDRLLNYFYNGCDLFVFPALYEGFGIPPLEAILTGAKIICSTNTEIPNIINEDYDVTWFRPEKDDLYQIMLNSIGKERSKTGRILDLPQWEKSARQLGQLISAIESKV